MPLLNRIIYSFIIVCFLALPVFSENETIPVKREIRNEKGQMELIQNEVNIKDLDIDPINTKKVKQSVVPDTKKEGKKILMLFFKTMLAVGFCSLVIFFILLFIKKFYRNTFGGDLDEDYANLDLATPDNKQDALKSFLDRIK